MIKPMLAAALAVLTALPVAVAQADTVDVPASHDLSVQRGREEPHISRNIHPKLVSDRETSRLDRFSMIRFDSEHFGRDVSGARLTLRASGGDSFEGLHRFRLYAVRDRDPQDELITERGYDPAADDTLYIGGRRMVDRRQVVILGNFTARPNEVVEFTSRQLTALLQQDSNGTVTLVITRETDGGENSTFAPSESQNPPTLTLVVPDAGDEQEAEAQDVADTEAEVPAE